MNSKDRRKSIEKILIDSNEPQKGNDLALSFNVTRQVIVKDIAILRAEGKNIIATPDGYIVPKLTREAVKRVIAVCHDRDGVEEELNIIVKFGGTIEDVIVEHPLYGEIRGMLMIKNLYDVQNFLKSYNTNNAKPLSSLTAGVHLHTIEADNEKSMNNIIKELTKKNFIISE